MTTTVVSNLDAALALHAAGFWPVAIYPKGHVVEYPGGRKAIKTGKEPIGSGWGKDRWTTRLIRSKFDRIPMAGVGKCMGPGRGPGGKWLIDAEGDGEGADDSFVRLVGGECVETRGWASTRGSHNLFTVDGERLLKLLNAAGAMEGTGDQVGVYHLPELPGLELRVGGVNEQGEIKQIQSVCPPTIGDNDKPREWNGVEEIAELPEMAYSLLEAIAEGRRVALEAEKAKAASTATHGSNGHTTHTDAFRMTGSSGLDSYCKAALANEIKEFSSQATGERHAFLLKSTMRLASLVKARGLTEAECLAALKDAAITNGMGDGRFFEVEEAWASALKMATARNLSHVGAANGATGKQQDGKPAGETTQQNGAVDFDAMSDEDLGIRPMRSFKKRRIEWDLKDRIPKHAYTLIAGEGKQGKSQVLTAIAAAYSTGGELVAGLGYLPKGRVLFLSAEDDPPRTIRPRLEALGADIDNISIMEARYKMLAKDKVTKLIEPTSFQNLDYWRAVFKRHPGAVAFMVDPLPSYMGRGVNDRRNAEVRQVLEPFIGLVVEFGMTMVGITHLGKSVDGRNAVHRVLDSIAYTNLARATHFISRDPDNPKQRLFMPGPCNYADADTPSIAFSIVEREIPDDEGGTMTVAVPEFDSGTVSANPDDIIGRRARGADAGPPKVFVLAKWLLDYMRQTTYPIRKGVVFNAAGDAGLIGQYGPDKDGKIRWSAGYTLSRAFDKVSSLSGDNAGWLIEESLVDGQKYWQAIRAANDQVSTQ